jgi:diguanylate cyclase
LIKPFTPLSWLWNRFGRTATADRRRAWAARRWQAFAGQKLPHQDIAARYGGEEFAVILPDTVLRSAITVADQVRRAVMNKESMKRSTGEHLGRITVSIGVAALGPSETPQSLIERADLCLYAAKRSGRNRVIGESDPKASQAAPKVA